jgi:hypothetical protein
MGILFLCDQYHSFGTVGESDLTGDEKFLRAVGAHAFEPVRRNGKRPKPS